MLCQILGGNRELSTECERIAESQIGLFGRVEFRLLAGARPQRPVFALLSLAALLAVTALVGGAGQRMQEATQCETPEEPVEAPPRGVLPEGAGQGIKARGIHGRLQNRLSAAVEAGGQDGAVAIVDWDWVRRTLWLNQK
jgi:hypothetical protein